MAAIVLTGASAGIGATAAVMLTAQGHEVLATGRSADKLAGVHRRMLDMAPEGVAVPEPIVADLAAMADVVALADQLRARCECIDVLANNAGLTTGSRQVSPDGFELTFAVNHLAPFLLTKLLVDLVKESGGRVVTTSSAVHRVGRLDLDDLQIERGWRRMRSYGSSKLANILFTTELRRRTGLPATCFHPGGVDTDLSRDSPFTRVFKWFGRFMRTPEQGADTAPTTSCSRTRAVSRRKDRSRRSGTPGPGARSPRRSTRNFSAVAPRQRWLTPSRRCAGCWARTTCSPTS